MEEDQIRLRAGAVFNRRKRALSKGSLIVGLMGIMIGASLLTACDSAPQSNTSSADKVAEKAKVLADAVNTPTSVNTHDSGTPSDPPVKVTPVAEKKISEVKSTSTAAVIAIPQRYDSARWHPIHFKPAIDSATNSQCLACHKDILARKPLKTSPAGVKASESIAWYQTLDTYKGEQSTFHARHLTSDYAKQVMDLKCNFCHQGNDPREEVAGSHKGNEGDTSHAMRKTVDPAKTCLLCHGKFPYQNMIGLEGPWHQVRGDLEDPEDPDMRNGCMPCHAETYRTVRHQVSYLKAENIEKLAKTGSSDSCYGCHGGRSWYRMSYPYPRHNWPGMEDVVDEVPEWAKNRPTESDPRYKRAAK